ncbi:TRAP transporter large permease [Mameliella sediminis]|uniref:TRAP transporter large permease n=1 Tax=Mameliella sediminis TaxID=2836866 RepID=UPI001C479C92|nr:TRAP transporter large permease [Mameliella sediminis]MBV7394069.1 TRAP transporter large permease [Mameliella sediminis]MBY6116030.1 TRAP transporter large permease [Antarctobacter heliothermus]MBY6145192.1 TRAP transporter large permease [Mameliella alba]MCA0954940.1 TRAP transporter large permease [Mameliella alba]
MDPSTIGAIGFFAALALLMLRVPIAFALMSVASVCVLLVFSWRPGMDPNFTAGLRPAVSLIEKSVFGFIHSYSLSMIPLFIAAGHLAYHSRITTDIYDSARVWMSRLPGGLAMASIVGCGGFSAITGSSLACASAMGRICVPEMRRFGYSKEIATSSVAVGGTLGSLIPPSVLFIVYGIFTETSISRLFLAGALPGLLTLVGFIITVLIWVSLRPGVAPRVEETYSRSDRISALIKTWPAVMLCVIIIGGIYGGWFTATEAAAVSLVFAAGFGLLSGRLGWRQLVESLRETAHTTASLFLIAAGAKIFVSFVSLTGVTGYVVDAVAAAELSNGMILLCIVVIYLIMGMFLDPLGTMLLTLPFVVPLVENMGYDLIWFGVVVVKLLEIGLISPPLGLNVFVVSSVVREEVAVHTIFFGVMKFLVMDLIVLALIVAFPIISLLLPGSMG